MKHVKKSVLLWYSPAEMYHLVTDVAAYPKFLPWCERGEVLEATDEGMQARVHMAFAGVRHAFTTRNRHVPDKLVEITLVDGPFSVLEGRWEFVSLGESDGQEACKVLFDLRYAFSSRPLELVLSPVFDRVANSLVDAFVQRAQGVYGER